MKTVIVELPDQAADVDEKEVRMIVAAKLFEQGKLSSGRAAEIVGISKRKFIETVGKYGVSIFGTQPEELEWELENARRAVNWDAVNQAIGNESHVVGR